MVCAELNIIRRDSGLEARYVVSRIAPAEVRGLFRPIPTSVPGIQFSEHMPRCAHIAHRLAVIRSMHHPMRNHNSAAVEALFGAFTVNPLPVQQPPDEQAANGRGAVSERKNPFSCDDPTAQ